VASLERRIAELEAGYAELASDVADLGRKVELAGLATIGVQHELEREVAEIDARITTVHSNALRAMTQRIGRSTPA
jgi:hypothetical protein